MTDLYQKAGVNIDLGNTFVERIKPLIRKTFSPGVITDIGGFNGLFQLDSSRYKEPVLVASTDGVGTKLMVAQMLRRHNTVGIDLVAMAVNDIIVQGAKPLFFLDYLATGKMDLKTLTEIVSGIVNGCQDAGCALIGGETAEMPGMYPPGEYDLAGFVVGIVERSRIINGSTIEPGDHLIGLASNGLHSNGFSLVRKIFFQDLIMDPKTIIPELGLSLGEELLKPTRIYARTMAALQEAFPIKGMAHITGGGISENLPRILPDSCQARLRNGSWTVPPVFGLIQRLGGISDGEMKKVFNNGLGMILAVPETHSEPVRAFLEGQGERCFLIGDIIAREGKQAPIVWV
jgi:phosphoribosylformylglycinamidine cyclo-ligase